MARVSPTMEMFLAGAYLQLVEGCDQVTYNAELMNPKEYWVEVVGRNEARQSIFYVDFAEKFDWYPPEMRLDTMLKKLVNRYVGLAREGSALEYEPENVHCQIWLPRPPARRVAEALPKVQERLLEQHQIRLEVVQAEEIVRRIPDVVERIRKLSFDCDNLFLRALLIAEGRLDYQVGAPMAQEQIEAMYRFPRALRSPAEVPQFVYDFLTSHEIVHWLDFDAYSFDDMRQWLSEAEETTELGDLLEALTERGEAQEAYDSEYQEDMPRRYSAADIAELTRLVLVHADELRRLAVAEHGSYSPLQLEIDFMLPFLSRVQERVDASQLEREILRYGGDRDQMMSHFASDHPDKHPYRAILRIELCEPRGARLPAYPSGKTMEVPIENPAFSGDLHVALTVNYVSDFTGYFVLMMQRLASRLGR